MILEFKAAIENYINQSLASNDYDFVFENLDYKPTPGKPYINVNFMFAQSQNPTFTTPSGLQHIFDSGYIQFSLFHPIGLGRGASDAMQQSLRAIFKRGTSFTLTTGMVTIKDTPSLGTGRDTGDRWLVPVKVFFLANLLE